jgi:hypothetical protein
MANPRDLLSRADAACANIFWHAQVEIAIGREIAIRSAEVLAPELFPVPPPGSALPRLEVARLEPRKPVGQIGRKIGGHVVFIAIPRRDGEWQHIEGQGRYSRLRCGRGCGE